MTERSERMGEEAEYHPMLEWGSGHSACGFDFDVVLVFCSFLSC
ncbi:hypothetical protein [Arsenophonus sp.]